MTNIEKIDSILFHIRKVEENCIILGKKLIENGKSDLGFELIVAGRLHDLSKFSGIEFEYLFSSGENFETAVNKHRIINKHHPECWGSIYNMPDVYIAEMVCDCVARSSEFGTDIKEWFFTKATKMYNFSEEDEVGQKVKRFLNLLLTPKFERIN